MKILTTFLILGLATFPVFSDTITLKSGKIIKGDVIHIEKDSIILCLYERIKGIP